MADMTPNEARDDLAWARDLARNEAGGGDWEDVCETLARAPETTEQDDEPAPVPAFPLPEDVPPKLSPGTMGIHSPSRGHLHPRGRHGEQ